MPLVNAKKTAQKTQNKDVGLTAMDHILAHVDIEKVIKDNKGVMEKILAKHVKEVLENYEWSEILYEALDADEIRNILRRRITAGVQEALFGIRQM